MGGNVIVRRVPADLVIRNARIIDGTGSPSFDGDVEVTDGRISGVGTATDVGAGTVELDAAGKVVSPGFVDTHTHDDGALLVHPGLEFKVAQGVTTLVIGNCGSSAIPTRPGRRRRAGCSVASAATGRASRGSARPSTPSGRPPTRLP